MSETQDDQALKPGSAPMMCVLDTEDARIAITHFPLQGDPAVVEAALTNAPTLITKIVWEPMELPARMAAAQEGNIELENIVSNDMTRVFNETTMRFLSAWQALINSHAVWHADYDIGMLANQLMQRGYLMGARQPGQNWHGNDVATRFDHQPGTPGSPQFVAAMMGHEYAKWLSDIP